MRKMYQTKPSRAHTQKKRFTLLQKGEIIHLSLEDQPEDTCMLRGQRIAGFCLAQLPEFYPKLRTDFPRHSFMLFFLFFCFVLFSCC